MANDTLGFLVKAILLGFTAIIVARYGINWLKAGFGLITDNEQKGINAVLFKIAGILFLLIAFFVVLILIKDFLG